MQVIDAADYEVEVVKDRVIGTLAAAPHHTLSNGSLIAAKDES
jgi:hypothetical protein